METPKQDKMLKPDKDRNLPNKEIRTKDIPEPKKHTNIQSEMFTGSMIDFSVRNTICILCGGDEVESKCKIRCRHCGAVRDCTDP